LKKERLNGNSGEWGKGRKRSCALGSEKVEDQEKAEKTRLRGGSGLFLVFVQGVWKIEKTVDGARKSGGEGDVDAKRSPLRHSHNMRIERCPLCKARFCSRRDKGNAKKPVGKKSANRARSATAGGRGNDKLYAFILKTRDIPLGRKGKPKKIGRTMVSLELRHEGKKSCTAL